MKVNSWIKYSPIMLLIFIYQDSLLVQSRSKVIFSYTGTYQTWIVPAVHLSATEIINGVDDNCNGKVDSAEIFCNACASSTFTPGNTFIVGLEPTFLASGDLNEDGKIDIMVSNRDNNNVSVVLGDGAGNFGSPAFTAVGAQPHSVALGDFNEDGHLDFATANLASFTISVLLGDGNGSFGSQTTYGTGFSPRTIIVGDWNADQNLDLAFTNQVSNTLGILLGNGEGIFQPMPPIALGNRPVYVSSADFNNDGKADLAVSNRFDNNISVLLGDGIGSFVFRSYTAVTSGTEPFISAAGDFNHDGKMDLAVKIRFSGSVAILTGDGTGAFISQISLPASNNFMAMAVGDFNLDGNLDVATDNSTSGVLSIYQGDGLGSFPKLITDTLRPFGSLFSADYNHDGKLDVATTAYAFLNNCTAPDIDGDGASDVCDICPSNPNSPSVFYADADGDGYGNIAVTTKACAVPAGYVSDSTDCNDSNAAVHPGATEVCNGMDDNCNGLTDENVTTTFYLDADGDGFGSLDASTEACSVPPGYVSESTDCDDNNPAVHPGATEVCNGIDDNCDGQADEGANTIFYADADGDGYGNIAVTIEACAAPAGYVKDSTDCNDGNTAVHPGATEVCNGIDDNCNGNIDEGCNVPTLSCTIKVSPAQTLPNHQPNTIYLSVGGQTLTLTGKATGGNGGYTYDWGLAGKGSSIRVSPKTNTTYTLTVQDKNGNISTCTVTIYVVNIFCGKYSNKVTVCHNNETLCLNYFEALRHIAHGDHLGGCNNVLPELLVSAHPNPTNNYFTVVVKSNNKTAKVKLRVMDLFSRVIEVRNNVTLDQPIQIGNNYARGVYILEVTQAGVRKTLLLIKLGNQSSNVN